MVLITTHDQDHTFQLEIAINDGLSEGWEYFQLTIYGQPLHNEVDSGLY